MDIVFTIAERPDSSGHPTCSCPAFPQRAYVNEAVHTKRDYSGGASISAASRPAIVAMMLEQLQLEPGQRVLELGANAEWCQR